jgi:hypothetical protein
VRFCLVKYKMVFLSAAVAATAADTFREENMWSNVKNDQLW